jgi:CheY-like chemotaxis protein
MEVLRMDVRSSKLGTVFFTQGTATKVSGLLVSKLPISLLLDMMLPKLSGLDVLRSLKADVLLKRIPVIVLSGLGQANETKLLKEGAAAFLVKSEKSLENNSSALIQTIQGMLAGTEART